MKIIREETKDGVLLKPFGKLDTTTSPEFNEAVQKGIDDTIKNRDNLVLDFSELSYVSSAGLRVLLAAQKRVDEYMGFMIVKNVNDQIMEVFHSTGFDDFLTIKEDFTEY